MEKLRLSVLDGLSIEFGDNGPAELTSLKARALFVYLAITAQTQSRQALAGLLWTDVMEDSARTSLRTALAQVRKAVGDYVQADRYSVWFSREYPHWTDAP